MWTVGNKPTLAQAIRDIDSLVDHCNNLSAEHKPKLVRLYRQYDAKGFATDAEMLDLEDKKEVIHGQYTSKMTGDKTLGYVRKELKAMVRQCPMCGINETCQLDHYMCESDYGQLACCRLNLVPTCGICNHKKSNDAYTNYVHAYYDTYPNVDFLITTITVKNNHIGMMFSIDQAAIGNADLARRTQEQFTRIELDDRLHKAGILYLNNMIGGLTCADDRELHTYLLSEEYYLRRKLGRNHWQASILRGLLNCAEFNMQVINAMRQPIRTIPVNGGGA